MDFSPFRYYELFSILTQRGVDKHGKLGGPEKWSTAKNAEIKFGR